MPMPRKERVKVQCDNCQKTILRLPRNINKTHNFCNRKCFNEWVRDGNLRKGFWGPCDNCNKLIYRCAFNLRTRKHVFCSRKCEYNWRSKNIHGKNHPNRKGIDIKCATCGKDVYFPLHRMKNRKYNGYFCSHECYSKSREKSKQSSEIFKKLWEDPNYRENMKEMGIIGGKKPNKLEIKFEEILREHNFPFKYVGNSEFWIGDLNPDFVAIDSSKKVIEVFGDYWHQDDDPQDRINAFVQHNWDCLVIWGHEIKHEKACVIERIESFIGE